MSLESPHKSAPDLRRDDRRAAPLVAANPGRPPLNGRRVARVALMIGVLGALSGGGVGMFLVASQQLRGPSGLPWVVWVLPLSLGAVVGAGLGALSAPILAFAWLRRVPLRVAMADCMLGIVVGGRLGAVSAWGMVVGSLVGCLGAALVVRARYRPREVTAEPAPPAQLA